MRVGGAWPHASGDECSAARSRGDAGRRCSSHARHAARRGRRARDRERRERRHRAHRRLRPAQGREGEHAHLRRRARLAPDLLRARAARARTRGCARRADARRPRPARRGAQAAARRLPPRRDRPARGRHGASAWASVLDVSQGGLALRTDVPYGAGDLIDVDLDDGTGRRDQRAPRGRRPGRRPRRRRHPRPHRRRGRRRRPAPLALVDRLRDSPSDGEPEPEPLPALREALAAERRRWGMGLARCTR